MQPPLVLTDDQFTFEFMGKCFLLAESLSWCEGFFFISTDACYIFPQFVLVIIPLLWGCDFCFGERSLHRMLNGASSLLSSCHSSVWDWLCSSVVGIEV